MEKTEKQRRFENKAHVKVDKIVKKINVLQNYAYREYYDYSALEVMALFSKIEAALKETREKYIYELQRVEGISYLDEEEDYDDEFDEED